MSSPVLAYSISVSWQPGHLHNGFLEVLYNNGLVGLFVMVMMHDDYPEPVPVMRKFAPYGAGCRV